MVAQLMWRWHVLCVKIARRLRSHVPSRLRLGQAVLEEILDESVASSRNRRNPRGVKRKMSNFPLRRGYKRSTLIDISAAVKIVK